MPVKHNDQVSVHQGKPQPRPGEILGTVADRRLEAAFLVEIFRQVIPAAIGLVVLDQVFHQYLLLAVQDELIKRQAGALANDDRYQHGAGQADQQKSQVSLKANEPKKFIASSYS
jgi:hypothetical protein